MRGSQNSSEGDDGTLDTDQQFVDSNESAPPFPPNVAASHAFSAGVQSVVSMGAWQPCILDAVASRFCHLSLCCAIAGMNLPPPRHSQLNRLDQRLNELIANKREKEAEINSLRIHAGKGGFTTAARLVREYYLQSCSTYLLPPFSPAFS